MEFDAVPRRTSVGGGGIQRTPGDDVTVGKQNIYWYLVPGMFIPKGVCALVCGRVWFKGGVLSCVLYGIHSIAPLQTRQGGGKEGVPGAVIGARP